MSYESKIKKSYRYAGSRVSFLYFFQYRKEYSDYKSGFGWVIHMFNLHSCNTRDVWIRKQNTYRFFEYQQILFIFYMYQ